MIELERQILLRKNGKIMDRFENVSYAHICKLINKSHTAVKAKFKRNSFSVTEAIAIYEGLSFKAKDNFDAFKLLFSEVDNGKLWKICR